MLQMVPLHFHGEESKESYVLCRVDAILNGGLILQDPIEKGKYWAMQGVREFHAFMQNNV